MDSQPNAYFDFTIRDDVLSSFKCPLGCERALQNDESSVLLVTDCPFGHPQSDNTEDTFRKIPSYLCVAHLMNRCSGSLSADPNGLVRCNTDNKFHVSFEELIDLDYFCEKMATTALALVGASSGDQAQANISPTPGPSGASQKGSRGRKRANSEDETEAPIECSICFSTVRPSKQFGLLDKCAHHFCASCILGWFEQSSSQQTCPICRKRSTRIVFWPEPVLTRQDKKKIFELQEKAIRVRRTAR